MFPYYYYYYYYYYCNAKLFFIHDSVCVYCYFVNWLLIISDNIDVFYLLCLRILLQEPNRFEATIHPEKTEEVKLCNIHLYDLFFSIVCLSHSVDLLSCGKTLCFADRIMCCTLNTIPSTQSLLNKCRLPLGLLLHPFRDLSVSAQHVHAMLQTKSDSKYPWRYIGIRRVVFVIEKC